MSFEPKRQLSAGSFISKSITLKEQFLHWNKVSPHFLLFSAVALLLAGTADTLLAKLMNKQYIPYCDTCEPKYFEGAFWQTFISYILEFACISVFFIDSYLAKRRNKKYSSEYVHFHTTAESFVKPQCPFWWWAIPSFLDFICSIGVNFSFIYLHASTAQLLRNFNIVITALLSLIWVRTALRTHQILGVLVVTLGLIVVGIQEFQAPDTGTNYTTSSIFIGVIFAVGGTLSNAIQVVIEERLFREYHASPCEAMGYFGLFGLIYSIIAFIILEFINYDGEKFSRNIYMLSTRNKEGNILLIISFVMMFTIGTFNLSGMTVTKLGSCLLRMIVISARTITIWLVELIVKWNTFGGYSLGGMILTIFGVLLYNYNYMVTPDSNKIDPWLRKPLMFFKFLKNPDDLERQALQTAISLKQQLSKQSVYDKELGATSI